MERLCLVFVMLAAINKRTIILLVIVSLFVFAGFIWHYYPLRSIRGLECLQVTRYDGSEETIDLSNSSITVTRTFDLVKSVYQGYAIFQDNAKKEICYNPLSNTFWFVQGNQRIKYVIHN